MSNTSDSDGKPILYEIAEKEAVKTTIVGGRPPGPGRNHGVIPRGIEVLIKKASVDPEFRSLLLEKRSDAAQEIDLKLSAAEVAILNAIPSQQIEKIIENTTIPNEQRRAFLGKAAAAMLAVLGFGLTSCDESGRKFTGIQPDRPSSDSRKSDPAQWQKVSWEFSCTGIQPGLPYEPPKLPPMKEPLKSVDVKLKLPNGLEPPKIDLLNPLPKPGKQQQQLHSKSQKKKS